MLVDLVPGGGGGGAALRCLVRGRTHACRDARPPRRSLRPAARALQIYLPPVIGMLVAGIMLENIPWGATDGWNPKWGSQMRAAALATIFLRCGLELDLGVRAHRALGWERTPCRLGPAGRLCTD